MNSFDYKRHIISSPNLISSPCPANSSDGGLFRSAELREAGYAASEAIAVGYSFEMLKAGGYPSAELLNASGYSAAELIAHRYSLKELHDGGYSFESVMAIGIPPQDIISAGWTM